MPNILSEVTLPNNNNYKLKDAEAFHDKAELYEGLETEEQQSIVSFEAKGADNQIGLTVAIEPVQDLHGYDHPWPAGGGKNLCPYIEPGSINQTTGEESNSDTVTRTGFIKVISGGTYTLSNVTATANANKVRIFEYGSGETYLRTYATTDIINGHVSFTIGNDVGYIRIQGLNEVFPNENAQVEAGSTATSFVPYSNICPISGWTGANVSRTGKNIFCPTNDESFDANGEGVIRYGHIFRFESTYTVINNSSTAIFARTVKKDRSVYDSYRYIQSNSSTTFNVDNDHDLYVYYESLTYENKALICVRMDDDTTYEPYFGTEYSVSFPSQAGTVYGGTLTVNKDGTGTLVVDHEMFRLKPSSEGGLFGKNGNYPNLYYKDIPAKYRFSQIPMSDRIKCLSPMTAANLNSQTGYYLCAMYSSYGGINIKLPITNLSEAVQWLTDNPIDVLLETKYPVSFALNADQITSLLGTNNLWADTGDILSLSYSDAVEGGTDLTLITTGERYEWNNAAEKAKDVSSKADKVSIATSGNFAALDENGNLTDSGSKASDFLTEHQDISGKLDKPATIVNDKFIKIDSNGNVVCGDAVTQEQITTAVDGWLEDNVDPETGYVLDRTLSMSNAATPADITGELKSALSALDKDFLDVNVPYEYSTGNKYDKSKVTLSTITENYKLKADGTTESSSNYCISPFLDIVRGKKYTIGIIPAYGSYKCPWANAETAMCFYDADKQFISSLNDVGNNVTTFTAPIEAKYFKMNFGTSSGATLSMYNERTTMVYGTALPESVPAYATDTYLRTVIGGIQENASENTEEIENIDERFYTWINIVNNNQRGNNYTYQGNSIDLSTYGIYGYQMTTEPGTIYKVTSRCSGQYPMAVFFNGTPSSLTFIGYYQPENSDWKQFADEIVTAPENAAYVVFNSQESQLHITVLKKTMIDINKKYTVNLQNNNLSILTNGGLELLYCPFGRNSLFDINSWKINNHTYTSGSDTIGPFNNLLAAENANGDRDPFTGFTGGNHGFNQDGSGSPTAELISVTVYCDGVSVSDGMYNCNDVEFVAVSKVQGANTCKSDGTGRNIIQQTTSYKLEGNKVRVNNIIKALEDCSIGLYYGMQMNSMTNYDVFANEAIQRDLNGDFAYRPNAITGHDSYSKQTMKMDNAGIGNYQYNATSKKATASYGKGYYCPINSTVNLSANQEIYFSGEYEFLQVQMM